MARVKQIEKNSALIMIDVQKGFDRADRWGRRDNALAEDNMSRLQDAWIASGRPFVVVQHDSLEESSTLSPSDPGNQFKDFVRAADAQLHIRKNVNSAFYGTPNLDEWLRSANVHTVVICGIMTNVCCETTARMAGNLGFEVLFPVDAMHTFDMTASNGVSLTAEELSVATVVSLDGGGFAQVLTTDDVLASLKP
jgi:nicotinamidase-related amidase